MRLTNATLATFAKYPRPAHIDFNSLLDPTKKRTSAKKFSFFNSETKIFTGVAESTGLKNLSNDEAVWARHPLAFLVEAADNICYRIIDLEDGYKLGYLTILEMEDLLTPLLLRSTDAEIALQKYTAMKDAGEKVGYLRAKAINVLVVEVMDIFTKNYNEIMSGEFDSELTDLIQSVDILEGPIKQSNIFLYNRKPVVEIELAGYQVIYGLLERFMQIHTEPNHPISRKLTTILPPQFLPNSNDTGYEKVMKIVDYIARMTDRFALNLYRRLSGQSLPS